MISSSELNFGKDENENPGRTEVPSKLGQDPTQVQPGCTSSLSRSKSTKGQFPLKLLEKMHAVSSAVRFDSRD